MHIKGVNLGNWLVLEKWMSPALFEGTGAQDEYYLPRWLSREVYEARIRIHRSEYITERDFAAIRAMGMEAVRIPVPYFIFGDREPFIGCVEELDRAFCWVRRKRGAVGNRGPERACHGADVEADGRARPLSPGRAFHGRGVGACFHGISEGILSEGI